MIDEEITLGGKPSNRPLRPVAPCDRPTVRLDNATRPHVAPRALDVDEARRLAADLLTGPDGMRRVGPRGIEELAWFVVRLDPASAIDPADDMATLDRDLEAELGAQPEIEAR